MTKVKPGSGKMSPEFQVPPEGWGLYEFTGDEVKVVGADKDCLQFDLDYVDNPACKLRLWTKYGNEDGRQKLTDVIYYSGVWPRMMKKYPDKCGFSIDDGIDDHILTNEKFHERLVHELKGSVIKCHVFHTEEEYKGEMRKRANIRVIESANSKSEAKGVGGAVSVSGTNTVTSDSETQEDGW